MEKKKRAELVLGLIEKNLKTSGAIHEQLKVQNDLMIHAAADVLEDVPRTPVGVAGE
jgi:hypothetical protein